MSDLPMTPVWGIHESVIRSGTSPGLFVVSRNEAADADENVPYGPEERSCDLCSAVQLVRGRLFHLKC